MQIKGSIFITVKEIQILNGSPSYEVARREHQKVRKALNKKGKYLTIKEYCDYFEVSYDTVVEYLNDYR